MLVARKTEEPASKESGVRKEQLSGCPFAVSVDRLFMSTARRALKRPAAFDSDDEDHDIVDSCSSSGGEAARETGSTSPDADETVSEDSDSEADDAAGATALCFVAISFNCFVYMCMFCRSCAAYAAAAINGFEAGA